MSDAFGAVVLDHADRPALTGDHSTVGAALAAAAAQFGEREAYVHGTDRLSFAEWDRRASVLAVELTSRGIRRGDVVALMLPSCIDYAVCYAALARIGAVTTGINTRLGVDEVTAIIDIAKPVLIVVDPGSSRADPPPGIPLLTRAHLAELWPTGRPAAHGGSADSRSGSVRPEDPVVIIWTSGTTGTPKGAWFDHRGLLAGVYSAGAMSRAFDRRLIATPFAHAGYMAKLWDQIAWGVTVVISRTPWTAEATAEILRDERITVAAAVPTQWSKLVGLPGIGTATFPDLRIALAATAPAGPDLIAKVKQTFGVPLVVRYAMTESPSISGTDPTDPPEVQVDTVGRAQTGMRVRVVAEDGSVCPPGVEGSVRARGTCVMRGYWADPGRTAATFDPAGWLITGDVGCMTEAGNLVLRGRIDDTYIRGGYNVHPLEVENILETHPSVDRAVVVGVPAPVIGEIGVAMVVPRPGGEPPTLAQLREWTALSLADYKRPDELLIVREFPLTQMSKLDRKALKRTAMERFAH